MVNIPTPKNDIDSLRRKVGRLELLVFALFTSESWDGDEFLADEFLHMYRRYFKRDMDHPRDKEFLYLFDRMIRHAPKERRYHFEQRLSGIEEQSSRAISSLDRVQARVEEQVTTLRASFTASVENMTAQVASSQEAHAELKEDVHGYLVLQSLGVDLSSVPLPRFIPIRVYLSEGDQKRTRSVSNAIRHLLDVYGFSVSDDFPEESGSWWKKWFAKTREVATQPEVIERLKKIERAVELQGLHKPQSEINRNEAEAVAALLKAVENVPMAAIQAGAILLIKTNSPQSGPCVQVRTLTLRELTHLERNQKLLASPHDILAKLTELNQEDHGLVALPEPSPGA